MTEECILEELSSLGSLMSVHLSHMAADIPEVLPIQTSQLRFHGRPHIKAADCDEDAMNQEREFMDSRHDQTQAKASHRVDGAVPEVPVKVAQLAQPSHCEGNASATKGHNFRRGDVCA